MTIPPLNQTELSGEEIARQMRRLTRRSFTVGAASALAGFFGFAWLKSRDADGGIPWPLRRMLEWNEELAQAYFRADRLAPTFARSVARMPRANGYIGLADDFDPAAWLLRVESPSLTQPLELSLDVIKTLPRYEMVTEFKCIEGWSDPVHWTGARLADLVAKFGLTSGSDNGVQYVRLATPDEAYYVGLDQASALHPQTLLCYAMNGEPLTPEHGAPLRLAIPVKYGIKNIKRIGSIQFTDERPADYWAERGYDWYAGH